MEKKDIASYSFEELQEEMLAIGEKGFRSRQIYSWIHEKLVDDFEEMTNLPKTLRQKLEAAYEIRRVEMEKRQISKIDGTNKFLFCLKDGNMVESVLMKYKASFLQNGDVIVADTAEGWLPDGMPFLCINTGRAGTKPDTVRDVKTGLPDPEDHWRESF